MIKVKTIDHQPWLPTT